MLLEKLSDDEWDKMVPVSPYSSFFHNSLWMNAVCKFVGGESAKILITDKKSSWLVPIYFGRPWSSTFRIGSIGYGGPLPLENLTASCEIRETFEKIGMILQKEFQISCSGITTFPWALWSSLSLQSNEVISETQIIPLLGDEEAVFTKVLSGNVRTAIRRASEYRIALLDEENGEEAYELLKKTQLRVGSCYVTQKSLFLYLLKQRASGIEVWGGFDLEQKLVAMSVLLIGNREAFHLFHGWDPDVKITGLNQALIWKMVESSIQKKCSSFNMGESHSESLKIAKKKWGAQPCPILKISYS